MPVSRAAISGSPYIGVYLKVGEQVALLPPSAPRAIAEDITRLFQVEIVRTTVAESDIIGALVAMNSKGALVGDEIDPLERTELERIAPLTVIRTRFNAMGNNVLVNDHGALVHPDFSDEAIAKIGKALEVPARRGTVAGLGTVGMAAIATNRGAVVHPRATEREAEEVAQTLGVPVHRSTANFGIPIVGACLVANSRAILVGRPTTPVEIVHLQEGLNVLD